MSCPYEKYLAFQLSKDMIADEPEKRPAISDVVKHPVWWSEQQILEFFVNVSDLAKGSALKPGKRKMLDKIAPIRENWTDWTSQFHPNLMQSLQSYRKRKYSGKSVEDLLRAVRNTVSCQSILIHAKIIEMILSCFRITICTISLRNLLE